ncbi:PASTA domain-containing protein [Streptomyces sp. LX-29]|uniref:PASTA domain-containing protein n=1 Tax=Streptomyces sp. LX-29 TaxID=2900152 RepID=UPI00240E8992|nr:PASTA domain-containing protein [Streptomyces sp. LX-29]WFB07275.1 PASTA domain-containing protein [Streptomyces sp. LX-29]
MVGVVLGLALLATGCGPQARGALVAAEAVGIVAELPFFSLGGGDRDGVRPGNHGGEQRGTKRGLFGGSLSDKACKIAELVGFLLDPDNRRKAAAWADALGIDVDEIEDYVDKLTPVLLGNDTLVRNHRFKNGKADPYDALLQAGIAVLIDRRGVPVVKCNCGNPLGEPEHDLDEIEVEIPDRGRWKHDKDKDVVVRPGDRPVKRFALRDVERPDRVIERPVGGGRDTTTTSPPPPTTSPPPTAGVVPSVVGQSQEEATQALADAGLTVEVIEQTSSTDTPGTVLSQTPDAGTPLEPGADTTVTLVVAAPEGTPESTAPTTDGPSPTDSPTDTGGPTEVTDPPATTGPVSTEGATPESSP